MRPCSFLLCILTVFASCYSYAQRNCGTVDYVNRKGASSFQLHRESSASNSLISRDTIANEIITIPVVFHIMYNNAAQNVSDEQVLSQLKALNDDFRRLNRDAANTPDAFKNVSADARIMFCLAQMDAKGRPQRGIIRKYTNRSSFSVSDNMKYAASGGDDAWDSKKYLNIWVCNMQSNCIGFGTPPGGDPLVDGIVIQYDCFGTVGTLRPAYNKGRTATHEIGHWMGLRHIWGDDACGNDEVDDTPSQAGYNSNCPSFPRKSVCSPNNNGDMFMNYMDYTNDACMNMFTVGQKQKMRACFAKGNSRNAFLQSFACDSSLAQGASLPTTTESTLVSVKKTVNIFPNPVQDKIHLTALNGYELAGKTVRIFTMAGRLMLTQHMQLENNDINVPMLISGVYLLSVGEGSERVQVKMIKL